MSNSHLSEIGKARVNTQLNQHPGGTGRKTGSPLKLRVTTHCNHGKQKTLLSEHAKLNVSKNNLNSALSEYSPKINPSVEQPLAGGCREEKVSLSFSERQDVGPEQVARQIPPLKAMCTPLPKSLQSLCELSAVLLMTSGLAFTRKCRLATGPEFKRT
ncbi:type VI secretion system contractile sheath small subunit [Pantoea sp. FN060301]|uniref:type VI secretion system contractile sheath small subunit n=1 Tax=Pantoea sp. FN060301 TaxID=3420380 RepID=UPI003D163798